MGLSEAQYQSVNHPFKITRNSNKVTVMTLSKSAVRDHQDFLRSNLLPLLAEGWHGYEQEGRGAVIIEDRTADAGSHWRERPIRFSYYSNQKAVSSNSGWPTRDIRRLVRDYNPHKQVVCVFLLADNLCAAYKTWDRELTPAAAAEQLALSDDSAD
jgi:hypothetical protein